MSSSIRYVSVVFFLVVPILFAHQVMFAAASQDTFYDLHKACKDGDLAKVISLCEEGHGINRKNSSRETPLHCAANNDQLDVVKELLRRGAEVDFSRSQIRKLKHKSNIIVELLAAGLSLSKLDEETKSSVFIAAASSGHYSIVVKCIDAGLSVDSIQKGLTTGEEDYEAGFKEKSVLFLAVEKGEPRVVKLLLEAGSNFEIGLKKRLTTPAKVARESVRVADSQVKVAVTAAGIGAAIAVDVADKGIGLANTAIDLHKNMINAATEGLSKISFGFFKPKYTDVERRAWVRWEKERQREQRRNSRWEAIYDGENELGLAMSDCRRRNVYRVVTVSPLQKALENENCEIAFLLLQAGAAATQDETNQLLLLGGRKGHAKLARIAVERGADNFGSLEHEQYNALLFDAAEKNLGDFVRPLVDQGANVNLRDQEGNTPLSLAVQHDVGQVASVLIELGADPYEMHDEDNSLKWSLVLLLRAHEARISCARVLFLAIANRDPFLAAKVLDEYEDLINFHDAENETPILQVAPIVQAVRSNTCPEVFTLLIERGAKLAANVARQNRLNWQLDANGMIEVTERAHEGAPDTTSVSVMFHAHELSPRNAELHTQDEEDAKTHTRNAEVYKKLFWHFLEGRNISSATHMFECGAFTMDGWNQLCLGKNDAGETPVNVLLRLANSEDETIRREIREQINPTNEGNIVCLLSQDYNVTVVRDKSGRIPLYWVRVMEEEKRELDRLVREAASSEGGESPHVSRGEDVVGEKFLSNLNDLLDPVQRRMVVADPNPNADGEYCYTCCDCLEPLVGLSDEALQKTRNFCALLKKKSKRTRNLLLTGPSGCGKALIARTIAHWIGARYYDPRDAGMNEVVFLNNKIQFLGENPSGNINTFFRKLVEEQAKRFVLQFTGDEDGIVRAVVFLGNLDDFGNVGGDAKIQTLLRRRLQKLLSTRIDRLFFIATTHNEETLPEELRRQFGSNVISVGLSGIKASTQVARHLLKGVPQHSIKGDFVNKFGRATRALTTRSIKEVVELACEQRDITPGSLELTEDNVKQACADFLYQHDRDNARELLAQLGDDPNVMTFEKILGESNSALERLATQFRDLHPDNRNDRKILEWLPKSILLYGPPGSGKTARAHAFAHAIGIEFYPIKGSSFSVKSVGGGAEKVRETFMRALQDAPCVLFVDEIDAVAGFEAESIDTSGANSAANRDSINTLTEFFTWHDEFVERDGCIFIAATNFPERLDARLKDRIEEEIEVDLPNGDVRGEIIREELEKIRGAFEESVTIEEIERLVPFLTQATNGYSVRMIRKKLMQKAYKEIVVGVEQGGAAVLNKRKFVGELDRIRKGYLIALFKRIRSSRYGDHLKRSILKQEGLARLVSVSRSRSLRELNKLEDEVIEWIHDNPRKRIGMDELCVLVRRLNRDIS